MIDVLDEIWLHIVWVLSLATTLVVSGHAVIHKRDPRSAFAWAGVIWLAPIIGAALYVIFGINRVQRRAATLRRRRLKNPNEIHTAVKDITKEFRVTGDQLPLRRVVDAVTDRDLLEGNSIVPLLDGNVAYPSMLEAIGKAERSITLCTYIFDNDSAGHMFREALSEAVGRGVDTRIIIDAVGARYSFPSIVRSLERRGVRVARFVKTFVPTSLRYSNLRNHRKILVVDGKTGFTGGMNIRDGHLIGGNPSRSSIHDLHFRIEGPVVAQMQDAFAEDWAFCTGELLGGKAWFPQLDSAGPVMSRAITDGPDGDLDKLRLVMLGALTCARERVRIMTPYFLPDQPLVMALSIAAMRGVQVEILLPETCNLRLVKWASTAMLWQVLKPGCRIFMQPGAFDHTKLMMVDDDWVLLGSANWDPRSFRLNFEFNIECYDRELTATLMKIFDRKLQKARQVTLAEVDSRSMPVRLRDGVARLFTPYL